MASKLEAARIASWSGVRTVIANSARSGVLAGAIADEPVGTSFEAHRRKLSARKLWIAFASRVAGHGDRRRRCTAGARRAPDEPAAGRRGRRRRPLRRGRHRRCVRDRRRAVRPRDGVRRGRSAPARRRPPHERPPAGHGPRGHPPRRPRAAARADAVEYVRASGVRACGLRRQHVLGWTQAGGCSAGSPCSTVRRGAGIEAELGAQLAEAALGLDVGRRLLDLEHA